MPIFIPSPPNAVGAYIPDSHEETRRLTYGDLPLLDGSVTYDQIIGVDGWILVSALVAAVVIDPSDTPAEGAFVPSGDATPGAFTPSL